MLTQNSSCLLKLNRWTIRQHLNCAVFQPANQKNRLRKELAIYRHKLTLWLVHAFFVIALFIISSICPSSAQIINDGGCNSNDATTPCFAKVPDVFEGRQHLLRVDDVSWATQFIVNNNNTLLGSFFSQSKNLVFGKEIESFGFVAQCKMSPKSRVRARIGRLFNLKNDVFVTLAPKLTARGEQCEDGLAFYIIDQQNQQDHKNDSTTEIVESPFWMQIALADFNRDGFDDIFFANRTTSSVYTAVDVDAPKKGVKKAFTLGNELIDEIVSDPVTGDFNGDGAIDVAWALNTSPISVLIKSVCPAADVMILGKTCTQPFEIIENDFEYHIDFPQFEVEGPLHPVSIISGDFNGIPNASTGLPLSELVLAASYRDSDTNKPVQWLGVYSFDSQLRPTRRSTLLLPADKENLNIIDVPYLASGRIDWFGQQDQLIYASILNGGLSVITFDAQTLAMTDHKGTYSLSGPLPSPCGLVVGRFDPVDQNASERDLNQQIAVLLLSGKWQGEQQETLLQVYEIKSSNDFVPEVVSSNLVTPGWIYSFPPSDAGGCDTLGNALRAGDLQGRSLRLGLPEKATVTSHIQPDTILGMPPMHVDWITAAGDSKPGILNVSVFPKTFNSQYNFQQTTGTQANRTSTTSYSNGYKESVGEKISYGIPDVFSISEKAKATWRQTHKESLAKKFNTYSGESYKLTAATRFDDLVAASAKQMNIYSYPVLGHCVKCANDSSCEQPQGFCPAGERQMMLQFSGPDNVKHLQLTSARGLEWYQPVHEPGNVFSYPGSLEQLKANQPQEPTSGSSRLQLLSPANNIWGSQSMERVSITWSEGGVKTSPAAP